MHRITLEAAVRAAWSLHLIGPFPNLPGAYASKIHDAGGMAPWLRLALGDEAAADVEKSGKASCHMGYLLGMEDGSRDVTALLSADPVEMHAIRIVDRLCMESPESRVFSLLVTLGELTRGTPAEVFMQPVRAAADESVENEFAPIGPWVPVILKAMADSLGIELDDSPADLSVWSDRIVGGTVASVVPQDRAPNGFVRRLAYAVVDCEDGVTRVIDDARGTRYTGSHLYPEGACKGMRLLLTFSGATSGHCGYLRRVEDRDMLDLLADLKARVKAGKDADDAVAARVARIVAGTLDVNGRRLAEGCRVELCRSCLEANEGTTGRVVEIMDDLVMVDFGRRIGKVPCYATAIAIMATSDA